MDPRQLKQLQTGKLSPTATLDLHGLDILAAKAELNDWLSIAAARHKCVLVIHGKGSGRLAEHCKMWLADHPAVRHINPAPPRHGGDGAKLLLLRKVRLG